MPQGRPETNLATPVAEGFEVIGSRATAMAMLQRLVEHGAHTGVVEHEPAQPRVGARTAVPTAAAAAPTRQDVQQDLMRRMTAAGISMDELAQMAHAMNANREL